VTDRADDYQRAMVIAVLLVNSPAAVHHTMIKLVLGPTISDADVFTRVTEMCARGLLEPGETQEGVGYTVSRIGLTWALRMLPALDGADLKLRAAMHQRGVQIDTALRIARERMDATTDNDG
jgi:hypothetical protein